MGASAIGLSHVAVQFPVYEFLKRWLGERRQKERGEASVADRLSTVDLIVASSTSKVIGFGFPNVPPAPLPAYQHAVCASVATVTPPDDVFDMSPCDVLRVAKPFQFGIVCVGLYSAAQVGCFGTSWFAACCVTVVPHPDFGYIVPLPHCTLSCDIKTPQLGLHQFP